MDSATVEAADRTLWQWVEQGELDKIASKERRKANKRQDKADRAKAREVAVQERQRQVTVKVRVQQTEFGGNRPGQVAQTWTTTRGCGKRERQARAQGEVQAEAQTQARANAQAAVQVQAVRRIQAAVAGRLARRAW